MVHLGLVTIVVDDYDAAIGFFVDTLGFELREDRDEGRKRWVVVGSPAGGSDLLLAEASDERQRARIGDQTGGRVGFFLHTEDFADTHGRLVAAGIRFEEEPRHEAYGTVAVFVDPWGNRWDLLQRAAT
ncbi:MAG: VOC family protein [Actinomycetota bacterium]